MAALYGRLRGQTASEVTRIGSAKSGIYSKLETWNGSVLTRLEADGTFTVTIGSKSYPVREVLTGNVDQVTAEVPAGAEVESIDRTRLDAIASLLDGQVWDADTFDAIAEQVRASGREVREPATY